ncbi:MAG: VWA domain-containing protein [Psychrosphaera sp.]|nr:VWA domain-containing protein [Psychrosphaera sp.]
MSSNEFFPDQVFDELINRHPIAKSNAVYDKLSDEIKHWDSGVHDRLNKENPFIQEQHQFDIAQNSLQQKISTVESIESDFGHFEALATKTRSPFNQRYWLSEINKFKSDPKLALLVNKFNDPSKAKRKNKAATEEDQLLSRTLLQQQWQKLLEQQYSKWTLAAIAEYRKALINKLSQWLELIQQLDDVLATLSIAPGLLFDLSKGSLSLSDLEQLKRWASYIAADDGVKKLCDLMGRLRRAEKTRHQEWVKTIKTVQEFVPDANSKEEIIGVHMSRDIEHALPHELALLADEQTSILFDIKFIEGRLMCFDMQGMGQQEVAIEVEEMTETDEEDKQGPVIICVDTSGSMQGSPETIAKAITLFMATRAINQKRSCFLINFSTQIETLDLSGNLGMTNVIQFLQRSFHGGTDASPALIHALELMEEEEYNKADLLMISDFLMASINKNLQTQIATAKLKNNKFYSLAIGELFLENKLTSIFDNEWVYSPCNSSIHSIQTIADEITGI